MATKKMMIIKQKRKKRLNLNDSTPSRVLLLRGVYLIQSSFLLLIPTL